MLNRHYNLQGKIALVTGSSRGIGRAVALGLAECGADVMLHARRAASIPPSLPDEIRACGVRCCAAAADLSDPQGARSLYAATVEQLGAPDILVLNASLQIRNDWEKVPLEEYQTQMQIDFFSDVQLAQLAVPAMRERHWGRIVTIGSVQQCHPHREMIVYAAAKSALANLVRNLAVQLAPDGITVNHVAPGVIETDRNCDVLANPECRRRCLKRTPVGFLGTPEDCVPPVLLFCAPESRFLTGCDLSVDGGNSLV